MNSIKKKNSQRISILDCPIDNVSLDEAIKIIEEFINSRTVSKCIAINADKIVKFKQNAFFHRFLLSGDLNITDGKSIVWAGRLFGYRIKERFGGLDIIQSILPIANKKGYKVYFLGGQENVINILVKIIKRKLNDLNIVGWQNGFWNKKEEKIVVKRIKEASPDILFIAISSPKREIFMDKYLEEIRVPFTMGVGGAFDVLVGNKRRAPQWVQKIGFEWLYRVLQEPKRLWKRYLTGNFCFIWLLSVGFIKSILKQIKLH